MISPLRIIQSIAFLLIISSSFSQEYFVDPIKGKDTYEGTEDRPFRLLSDAVKIANEQTGSGKHAPCVAGPDAIGAATCDRHYISADGRASIDL